MLESRRRHLERPSRPTCARLPPLRIKVGRWVADSVLIVTGEIDLATAPKLQQCLDSFGGHVVVDLRGVSFLDASGLGVFAKARQRLLAGGGDLRLRSPQPQVRRVLKLTGFGSWIVQRSGANSEESS